MHKRLICFDFDQTLIDTPEPESGKPQWERITGQKWLSKGWWGNPESLNLDVFQPPVNRWVYNCYKKEISEPDTYVFLATGRLEKLKKQVLDILEFHDVKLDDVFCNTGGDTFTFKCKLFEKIISDNPDAEEFTMYDDRQEHLSRFADWAKNQSIKVNVIDALNKKQIF